MRFFETLSIELDFILNNDQSNGSFRWEKFLIKVPNYIKYPTTIKYVKTLKRHGTPTTKSDQKFQTESLPTFENELVKQLTLTSKQQYLLQSFITAILSGDDDDTSARSAKRILHREVTTQYF